MSLDLVYGSWKCTHISEWLRKISFTTPHLYIKHLRLFELHSVCTGIGLWLISWLIISNDNDNNDDNDDVDDDDNDKIKHTYDKRDSFI